MPTARAGVRHHAHVFRQRAFGAIERADFFAGLRATNDDAVLLQFIEIESVQRVAQLEHHVIGHVHHVVDGFFADRFQALPQPVRRRLHFHSAQHARRETPAKIRRRDFHARRVGYFFRGFFQLGMQRLQRQAVNRRHFARDAQVAQAIRAIRGDFRVQHRPRGGFFDGINGHARKR